MGQYERALQEFQDVLGERINKNRAKKKTNIRMGERVKKVLFVNRKILLRQASSDDGGREKKAGIRLLSKDNRVI